MLAAVQVVKSSLEDQATFLGSAALPKAIKCLSLETKIEVLFNGALACITVAIVSAVAPEFGSHLYILPSEPEQNIKSSPQFAKAKDLVSNANPD